MTEPLNIDILDEAQDPLPDLYENLKSPDRTKTWKGSRLRRAKTYSGSPNNRMGNENFNENAQSVVNKIVDPDKPIPLSPVNQRKGKWNKTNMKRRSTITARDKLNKSYNDRSDPRVIRSDCFALSTTKVEVRNSSDISKNAVMHRYSCQCKQYLDEATGIIYKLQEHQSFDSNIIGEQEERLAERGNRSILNSSIVEEEQSQIRSSTVAKDNIQTYAENTKAEEITGASEFNFDFQSLDDTILELQTMQGQIREVKLNNDLFSESRISCCEQSSIDRRRIPSTILDPMSETGGSSVVYLLISVFSYLDLDSLLEAGKVCRTWHCATQHPAVWRNVAIQGKKLTTQALHNLAVSCTSTQQLSIEHCSVDHTESNREELVNMFNSMSQSLKALYLSNNSDGSMILEEAISGCSSITRLFVDDKIVDSQLDSISTELTNLTCLTLGNTRGLNPTQFYEIESVTCLTFSAAGLRVDEVASIAEWFPNLKTLHIKRCTSLHSLHAKSVLGSVDKIHHLRLTDTYTTPRALLFILCSMRELKSFTVHYSRAFTNNCNFKSNYLTTIKKITDHPLFSKVLTVTFEGPADDLEQPSHRTSESHTVTDVS